MENKKQFGNAKRTALWIIAILSMCGIVVSVYRLIDMQNETLRRFDAQNELSEAVIASPTPSSVTAEFSPTDDKKSASLHDLQGSWLDDYTRKPDKTINFEALHQINEDIVAWVTVPGTRVDYPIVYAIKGDERYLNYDIKGNESKYGAIFIEDYNGFDFSNPVTVVYGHNMKDGSMFNTLHNFENSAFFDENRIIRVYISDYMLEYEIIAAYKTDDTHILAAYDFRDKATFMDYLEGIYSIRDLNAKLRQQSLSAEDRLITLATCVQGEDDARYLVQGVLTRND